jgi:hypothetical protein
MIPGSSRIVTVNAVGSISQQITWTDATMNVNGTLIALLSYKSTRFFPRSSSQTVADALQSSACSFISPTETTSTQHRFESLSFMPFPYYAVTSECLNKVPCTLNVYRYKLIFQENATEPTMVPAKNSSTPIEGSSKATESVSSSWIKTLLVPLLIVSLLLISLATIVIFRTMKQKTLNND